MLGLTSDSGEQNKSKSAFTVETLPLCNQLAVVTTGMNF